MAGPRGRSEAGTTLVEVIVAVAIMGFALLALMGGIGTSIIFADVQRRDASIGLVLASTAEKVVADTTPYQPCAPTYAVASPDPAIAVTVEGVLLWNVTTNTFVPTLVTCPTSDSGLQLIKLRVTSTSANRAPQVDELEVVKRLASP